MNPARILVVDDTPQNVMLLATSSRRWATPGSRRVGPEALARIAAETPQLVPLTSSCRSWTATKSAGAIRNDPKTAILPVATVTVVAPAEERTKGLEAGADDFLTKPIDLDELRRRVRGCCGSSRSTKRSSRRGGSLRSGT